MLARSLNQTLSTAAKSATTCSRRLVHMSSHLSHGQGLSNSMDSSYTGTSIRDIPKSNNFTTHLPTDTAFPTPSASHKAPRETLGPRMVRGALYTYVRPESVQQPELLGVSPVAMRDLGIRLGEQDTEEFKEIVCGNSIVSWDADKEEGIYPWAQCYGGWQFGSWASQLGDGRAISLFETTNTDTRVRYELQLKGAGRTPYSRFADGKAVLRSSIREFIVSEALNALNIPTTRALALTLLPRAQVVRERVEPGAIVCRFAQSWLRIGTFDLLRSRGDRKLIRQLATYLAEEVFQGWKSLPARIPLGEIKENSSEVLDPPRNVPKDDLQGPEEISENRFARLYREIVRRNARTVAAWQAYGFMNGVLNTDNTSVFGLSIDFGPFAFMDNFDSSYTPNHDDHMNRYSYKNQPTIIWWNLVRLGEDLGELLGAGDVCDAEEFMEKGVSEKFAPILIKRAEGVIERAGDEYRAVFLLEYKRLMIARLGLRKYKESDFDELMSGLLDTLESLELDFNGTFRKLSGIRVAEISTEAQAMEVAARFFHHEGVTGIGENEETAREKVAVWLGKWRQRVVEDWGDAESGDLERERQMKKANPKFVPRGWVLDELIQRVEKQGEREVLARVLDMALRPFEDEWGWDRETEERLCGDVPRSSRAMQCSCSS